MVDEQSNDNPKIKYAIEHAHDLLKLLEEILSKDDVNPSQNYLHFAKALTYKLFAHCTTTLRLVQQEEARVPFGGNTYIDMGSVRALVRVCVETYLTLFEVFFEHINDIDISDFRLRIWLLKGIAPGALLRERIPYLLDAETVAKYESRPEERKKQEEEFKKRIKENDYFRKLEPKERKEIEANLQKPENYHRLRYDFRGREQQFSAAGLNKHILAYVYSDTSSFIHSDGYSAWEANPFSGNEGTSFVDFYLFISIALIGRVITHFASLSEHYVEICQQQPKIFKLANNLSEEIMKGGSDTDATPET